MDPFADLPVNTSQEALFSQLENINCGSSLSSLPCELLLTLGSSMDSFNLICLRLHNPTGRYKLVTKELCAVGVRDKTEDDVELF
ncbi:hypothetical protein HZ326_16337 [Fusarium oxysporum f. sp. albedinis]|nr:hypothetical protein HZ326_16337 [Fusarium oxysporum f. sp. albedinis]